MSEPSVSLKMQPWQTPNYASVQMPAGKRQDGFVELPKLHVRDLDVSVLSEMCDRWRADVFAKAGKDDPRGQM